MAREGVFIAKSVFALAMGDVSLFCALAVMCRLAGCCRFAFWCCEGSGFGLSCLLFEVAGIAGGGIAGLFVFGDFRDCGFFAYNRKLFLTDVFGCALRFVVLAAKTGMACDWAGFAMRIVGALCSVAQFCDAGRGRCFDCAVGVKFSLRVLFG